MPPPPRAWTRVSLVCALLLALAGLACPAMSMSGDGMSTVAAMAGDMHDIRQAAAADMADADGPSDGRAHCPMADRHDEVSQAPLRDAPTDIAAGLPLASVQAPREPGPAADTPAPLGRPPELHRLCVSRT